MAAREGGRAEEREGAATRGLEVGEKATRARRVAWEAAATRGLEEVEKAARVVGVAEAGYWEATEDFPGAVAATEGVEAQEGGA